MEQRPEAAAAVSDPPRGGRGVVWTVALVLLIVGGLNWGVVGLFGVDVVASLFGDMSTGSRIVYGLVGLAALVGIVALPRVARAG